MGGTAQDLKDGLLPTATRPSVIRGNRVALLSPNRWMNGWMDGWMNGWMDGWKDEWMDVHVY